MWEPKGTKIDLSFLGKLNPVQVLDEYDYPMLFTAQTPQGAELLCYVADFEDDCSFTESEYIEAALNGRALIPSSRLLRHIVCPTDALKTKALLDGKMRMYDALKSPWMWIADKRFTPESNHVCDVWSVDFKDIPEKVLPNRYVTLYEDQTPFLTLKAEGPELSKSKVPGSAIATVISSANKAMKVLAEYKLSLRERPYEPAELKAYCNLNVVETKAASFEAAFAVLDELVDKEILKEINSLLEIGLNHLAVLQIKRENSGTKQGHMFDKFMGLDLVEVADSWNGLSPEEKAVVTHAMQHLTPPQRGPIKSMAIRGPISEKISGFRFERTSSREVHMSKSVYPEEGAEKLFLGFVRQWDRDKNTAIIRSKRDDNSLGYNVEFDDSLYYDVEKFFTSEGRVWAVIASLSKRSTIYELKSLVEYDELDHLLEESE